MPYSVAFMMDGGIVKIEEETGVMVTMNRPLTCDEMAAAGAINEIVSRLKNGKFVSYNFQPLSFEAAQQLIKCEWLRSGNLRVHGPVEKPYRHCTTVEEATKEHRSFTCPRALLSFLPKHREEKR